MRRTTGLQTLVFLLAVACLVGGCSAGSTSSHMNKTLHAANLDADYAVLLCHRSSKHREGLNPEQRSEQLIVEIVPRPRPRGDYTVADQTVPTWPSNYHY